MLPGVAGMVTTICSVTRPSSRFQTNILKQTVSRLSLLHLHSPVVHVEFLLFEEALGCRVLGLHSAHELVELSPLLPHGAGHVLRDLSDGKLGLSSIWDPLLMPAY